MSYFCKCVDLLRYRGVARKSVDLLRYRYRGVYSFQGFINHQRHVLEQEIQISTIIFTFETCLAILKIFLGFPVTIY